MSKRSKKKRVGKNQRDLKSKPSKKVDLDDNEWSECPECGVKLKSRNLASHGKKVHRKEFDMDSKEDYGRPRKKELKNNGSRTKGTIPGWHPANIIFVIIISSILLFGGYYLYNDINGDEDTPASISSDDYNKDPSDNDPPDNNPPDNDPPDNNQQDNDPPVDQNDDWLKSYTPGYEVGSGNDDWWVNYPSQHPENGASVDHPQWVQDEIAEGPVIMLVHSQCEGCAQQTREVPEVVEQYPGRIKFFDIDIYDNEANYEIATEIFDIYDPNEEAATIPITVLVSKIQNENGNNVVIWHGMEGNTGKDWIDSHIRDSIYYYPETE